ncbi:MAG: hypothetical protein ACK5N8_07565 [Alphaproteobacteria bacterium]
MIKKMGAIFLFSILSFSNSFAADLFSENYQDEKLNAEIQKNVKKYEVIAPEEIARVQNQVNKVSVTKVNNMDTDEARTFVKVSNRLLGEADEGYRPTNVDVNNKQDVKAFYDNNFGYSISNLANDTPDEY